MSIYKCHNSYNGHMVFFRQASDQLMDLSMNEQNKAGRTKSKTIPSYNYS